LVSEEALESGVWPDRKFHKLIFMGCHATTGHGHIMEIDPHSGNYTINLFEHGELDPMSKTVARHHRLEMTQFQVAYVGKDEIVMYDGNTAEYKIYIVEPRLPLSLDEDPIGPFNALDEGKYALHEQLLYVGNNYLLDYSAVTGDYTVHKYDRGATVQEQPFTLVDGLGGKLDRYLQLTYLGLHQVLAFYPTNGTFKVFDLTSNVTVEKADTNPYYGFGSVLTGEICVGKIDCRSCISHEGCGWCATNHLCMRGALGGPCGKNCTSWEMTVCPGEPCYTHRDCSLCLQDPFCGWCADSGTCTEGTLAGPLFGACNFSKFACPVYVPPPGEEEKRCTEEIE